VEITAVVARTQGAPQTIEELDLAACQSAVDRTRLVACYPVRDAAVSRGLATIEWRPATSPVLHSGDGLGRTPWVAALRGQPGEDASHQCHLVGRGAPGCTNNHGFNTHACVS